MSDDPSARTEAGAGRPLQDLLRVHCYGCGALNEKGLQIKSRRDGDELVCRWRAQPFHIGYPGYVHGGTIASVVDCHAIWAAIDEACRAAGHDLAQGPLPFNFVTGRLSVNFRQPVRIDGEMELRARVVEPGERKTLVACRVLQDGQVCVDAEVLAVRVKPLA